MNNPYLTLYLFFNKKSIFLVRIGIFLLLALILFISGFNATVAKGVFFVYFVLIVHELFILDKVNKSKPPYTVAQMPEDIEQTVDFGSLFLLHSSPSVDKAIVRMKKEKEVQFILAKIGQDSPVIESGLTMQDVIVKAAALVSAMKGTYIYTADLFIAYLLLTEEKTNYLLAKDLHPDDVLNILYWTRHAFKIDFAKDDPLLYKGEGIFDALVYGWHVEVKKYARNLTSQVLSDPYPPTVVGRSKEYEQLLTALLKDEVNNVLFVGEPGTGKTSLVEYLAFNSYTGNILPSLRNKVVYELLVDQLLAGVSTQGMLQERLSLLLTDLHHAGNTILYVQNIENIFGGGGVELDVSGVLFEYLQSGGIRLIGTTTPAALSMHLEKKASIKSLFEVVRLDEPSKETALFMLFEKVKEIESRYQVRMEYAAVQEAVRLSSSYDQDRYLPGKAINLLQTVGAYLKTQKKVLLQKSDVIHEIEKRTNIVLQEPTQDEKQKLLSLEDEIHKRIINQEKAVKAIATAMRRVRSGLTKEGRPIATFLFLGPTGVGKTETAKALAALYFQDESRIIRLDMSEYQTQDSISRLLGSPGGAYVPHTLTEEVMRNPFSLILLDEFEKAHPQILDIFLQVLDEGRLTDNNGHTVSFANTIIIATSNAGSEMIRQYVTSGKTEEVESALVDSILKSGLFRPELVNRFDEVVVFTPLSREHIREVVKLQLQGVLDKLQEQYITLSYDENLIDFIIQKAYSLEFGARNVRRYIQSEVEEVISRGILENRLVKGSKAVLAVDENSSIVLRFA